MIQLEIHTKEKETLSTLLERLYPGMSKNKLKGVFKEGRILRNSFAATKDADLKVGEKISILKKPKFLGKLLVYYLDKDIAVVEKPAYLLSVDADNDPGHSVHASLKRALGAVYPVQRLDRETTGVMVFALSPKAKESLKKQLEERTPFREYIAVARGGMSEKKGTWKSYLYERGDKKMMAARSGKLAITHYEVLKSVKDKYSLLSCRLETGRKNQIRVHAADAGHPLLGDSRYGEDPKKGTLFLHAHKLSFVHPTTGKTLSFISPIPSTFYKKTTG